MLVTNIVKSVTNTQRLWAKAFKFPLLKFEFETRVTEDKFNPSKNGHLRGNAERYFSKRSRDICEIMIKI